MTTTPTNRCSTADGDLTPLTQPGARQDHRLFLVNRIPNSDQMLWRPLNAVSLGTVTWDGAPEGSIAVESQRHEGAWSYVKIKVTGRTQTRIPLTAGAWGLRVQVDWNVGGKAGAAWIAAAGDIWPDIEAIKAQIAAATKQTTRN